MDDTAHEGLICGAAEDASAGRSGEDRYPGLILRQKDPDNLELPFSALDGSITPNERFFVRNHFDVPKIDVDAWCLRIEGAVDRPCELTHKELCRMPVRSVVAVLECSGNNRVFVPALKVGLRWELGAVGNAAWSGVPLAAALALAGVRRDAVDVVLEGADKGSYGDPEPETPGEISYARALPLAKAMRPEVILAYWMNGEELTPSHGYPLRAVVPGWYGMASVKWLTRVLVMDRPFHGYFHTFQYSIWERIHGLPSLTSVTEVQVKAEIARPAPHEVVQAGSCYRVCGAAWAGESHVVRVELSDDCGQTWNEVRLLDDPVDFAWRRWEYRWRAPSQPGRYVVSARATDALGRVQPMVRDPDRRDVAISHVLPIEVVVR